MDALRIAIINSKAEQDIGVHGDVDMDEPGELAAYDWAIIRDRYNLIRDHGATFGARYREARRWADTLNV